MATREELKALIDGQLGLVELGDTAFGNFLEEFNFLETTHFPTILPALWVPEHPRLPKAQTETLFMKRQHTWPWKDAPHLNTAVGERHDLDCRSSRLRHTSVTDIVGVEYTFIQEQER
jgi:hypothetical protein